MLVFPYIFIPEYYHSNFGINLVVLSIALFILRTLDAIFDPIIGWYCDEFHYPSKISLIAIITIFIAGVYIICIPVFTNIIVNLALEIFFIYIGF